MPRRTKKLTQPTRLKQESLEAFFVTSSPPQPPSSPLHKSPSPKVSRTRNATRSSKRPAAKERVSSKKSHSLDSHIPDVEDGGDSSSDPGKIHFEPEVVSVSDSEEEVKSSPRRPAASQAKKRRRVANSDDEGVVVVSTDTEEENIGVPVRWKGKAKEAKGKPTVVHSDSEEEEQPRRRKLVKGVRPLTPEEDDLMAEVDESKIINSRLRTRDKRSVYLQNLEKLKKKKRGESVVSEPSEDEDDPDDYVTPFEHARPDTEDANNELGTEHSDEELEGFIEDDGDAVAPELPVEFSMNTYQDLMHHFKIICQLFVHLAVQRRKDRRVFVERSLKDQYFAVPLQIARRKLEGMRDSLVASSVWRPAFKKALGTYPEFEVSELDFAIPNCDACHLGGRISTLVGRLSGEPYDKTTFQPLNDSESDEDEQVRLRKEFHLGRFCARRTRAYHRFTHWEYALFKVLLQEVDDLKQREGSSRVFVRIAFAGGKKPPDDLTDADGIMSWLDERGIIATEWQRIKEMMDNAEHLEIAAKRGDDAD